MSKKSLTIKVPGKLMVAGEFAVLEPCQKLIVMAVDRFVYATISDSEENGLILGDLGLENISWNYQNGKMDINSTDKRLNFVEEAMLIACKYITEQSIPLTSFVLKINSELDDDSGVKYGLGSSAAVVTSVISAILNKFLQEQPSELLIFKLAAISHVKTQGNGSGADIAASSYGGVLQYSSFQAEWLLDELMKTNQITALIEKEWTYLSIKQIQFPTDLSMCIGWTGQPASTANLVDEILSLKDENEEQFRQFLRDSTIAVEMILKSIEENSRLGFLNGIRKNRSALAEIGEIAGVEIETPTLRKLARLAERFNGAGKLSGAGGGDCGIAFIPSSEEIECLLEVWKNAGIKPLPIKMYTKGAKVM